MCVGRVMQEQLPRCNVGHIASYELGVATPKTNKKTGNFGGLFIMCYLSYYNYYGRMEGEDSHKIED